MPRVVRRRLQRPVALPAPSPALSRCRRRAGAIKAPLRGEVLVRKQVPVRRAHEGTVAARRIPSCSGGRCPPASVPPMSTSDRDRDDVGPRAQRPPAPRASADRCPTTPTARRARPEGVVRTPGAALTEAQPLLDAGRPFHAHEVLEDAWKAAPEPERELWRGLAQLAVGLTHALRGNAAGRRPCSPRGAANLEPFAPAPPHDIDVPGLARLGTGAGRGRRNRGRTSTSPRHACAAERSRKAALSHPGTRSGERADFRR